ncbi:thioredoxin domain-containing protein [Tenacibaculum retecalamus]|uniref:thioredoxin domain-containing protein n=1 Tax=Tenacibaculum retecalamus TaxID=3018315 RepID=UPI0023D90A66|nr:thioredoxin domain-containing protein [Tenacibaculum retecalamus]WBX71045.1 thioredoxin domain-containing protein [Tenacibaculum retecalamus]
MKKSTIILFLLIINVAFGQQINSTTKDSKGTLMLLGKTDKNAFNIDDFSWFQENYNQYLTNDKVVRQLKKSLSNYTIKAFYGSWCGDSKREIPKFYKVIDEVGFNTNKLSMIAVDKKPEAYKASPNGEEKGLNIHRVPTFIFYKNDKEIGRIVESPKQDFERDILTIINGKNYTPNYIVVERLHALMKVKTIKELQKDENNVVISFSEFTKGSRELNTYGYKLLRSKNTEKALFVFQLNTKMYPYKYSVFDSLGEAYFTIKNYEQSLKNYNKVLQLKPNDVNALSMIEKIKKVI